MFKQILECSIKGAIILSVLVAGSDLKGKSKSFSKYILDAFSDKMILPKDKKIPGKKSNKIRMIIAPNELESASFLLQAKTDMKNLTIEPTALSSDNKIIPASNIDIKIVKCWFQGGNAWCDIAKDTSKKLTPELLLKDDSLISVDNKNKVNYIKLNYPEGEKYICVSDENEKTENGPYKILSIKDFPVKDSKTLQAFDIAKDTNKQIWLTVKIPKGKAPGFYHGKINIKQNEKVIDFLDITVRVLPFELSSPDFTSSVFYRGRLSEKYPKGTISAEFKSLEQLKAELKDMLEHGVFNPTCYQPYGDKKLFKNYLKARREVGMTSKTLYSCYGLAIENCKNIEILKKQIKEMLQTAKAYGINEIYFFGRDEAQGTKLVSQRKIWKAVHEAGGKIFTTGYKKNNFKLMGDIQDLCISWGYPSLEESSKWHSVKHKIWAYFNPQAGLENPEIYRRNFGLLLWQKNYDGACTFAYQTSMGNVWNDFDYKYRDHNFTYPTVDGVIDTIAWEGYREGIDDLRYATTLEEAIKTAKKSNNAETQKNAAYAEEYLKELKTTDLSSRNLNVIRMEIIDLILKLKAK
jgi:hypothetical protein